MHFRSECQRDCVSLHFHRFCFTRLSQIRNYPFYDSRYIVDPLLHQSSVQGLKNILIANNVFKFFFYKYSCFARSIVYELVCWRPCVWWLYHTLINKKFVVWGKADQVNTDWPCPRCLGAVVLRLSPQSGCCGSTTVPGVWALWLYDCPRRRGAVVVRLSPVSGCCDCTTVPAVGVLWFYDCPRCLGAVVVRLSPPSGRCGCTTVPGVGVL